MNSRPCGFGYDYDYLVGDENLNDGSHCGIDEFSGREPYSYEQSPWQPSPSSYYDGNPSYNAYHSYEHDDSYHGYTSQPPPFYVPYSQPTSYFHQLPTYDPNLYSPYAYPCDDYEQATLESPPLQHLYLPTQIPMNDTLDIILQEQEELQTAFTSFTSTLQEFTSRIIPPSTNNQNNFPPQSFECKEMERVLQQAEEMKIVGNKEVEEDLKEVEQEGTQEQYDPTYVSKAEQELRDRFKEEMDRLQATIRQKIDSWDSYHNQNEFTDDCEKATKEGGMRETLESQVECKELEYVLQQAEEMKIVENKEVEENLEEVEQEGSSINENNSTSSDNEMSSQADSMNSRLEKAQSEFERISELKATRIAELEASLEKEKAKATAAVAAANASEEMAKAARESYTRTYAELVETKERLQSAQDDFYELEGHPSADVESGKDLDSL
ncbi:uncharacterized protein LOC107489483 [Arachis duranensis]|uniref:Uncharacterized protein LOC107489483 n=1 Tax=Arachis duranensis TaxID=130453 RepID=A0A6P4DC38_ARADU|nr:uncharacterized protein LOC107489483 [Arachis duranensis]